MRQIVLASSSPYRKTLLERLRLPFAAHGPDVDETRAAGESPSAYVTRLAQAKASALVEQFPDALIVGSDQCAVLNEVILGKPGTRERARQQLAQCSGSAVVFHTGLCLLDSCSREAQIDDVIYTVHFRDLEPSTIEDYLDREAPYDCAGSFKSEGLGVALFERMEGDDPTALVGLPLIRLCAMLRSHGVDVLSA